MKVLIRVSDVRGGGAEASMDMCDGAEFDQSIPGPVQRRPMNGRVEAGDSG